MEELEMLRVRTKLLEILTNRWAMVVTADADVVVRDIVLVDGARLAGGEYERQPGSYGWRSCHLLPWPSYLPAFGNHRHHHQLIKITIVIAIAIIIKNATISDKERVQKKWNYPGSGSSDTATTSPSPLAALPRHSYIGLCRRGLLSGWASIWCCNFVNAILLNRLS